ncbi:MAG: DegT/DnrJ/EryC1/StrS family aminotransferase [Ignavibacteria bacterium]
MKIPLLDLKAQYESIKSEVENAVLQTLRSQKYILGPEVSVLESAICKYLGCKHAIGVSSGTDALLVALMAIGIKAGDEIILPTYSFFATAGVVARLNAVPVFVDIDLKSYNILPEDIERKITSRTKAIIPVHLYGQCAMMNEIMEIANKYNLKVIEDAAQAIGAEYLGNRKAGTIGNIGCFSFFPSKNLGGVGDGGMVVTNNDELAEKIRILRVHGGKPKYYHKIIGGNFRLDTIQATVLNVKLKYLSNWSKKRQHNADLYNSFFIENKLASEVGKTDFDDENRVLLPTTLYKEMGLEFYHIYNQYVIRVQERDRLKQYLQEKGIGTEIYYPIPFHKQECFLYLLDKFDGFSYLNAERAAAETLALPIYPELTQEQILYVVETIRSFFQ